MTTPSVSSQHSAAIKSYQWDGFAATISDSHPDATYSPQQRRFLQQLLDRNGNLRRSARFSLVMIRDEWASLLKVNKVQDLFALRKLPTNDKVDFILDAFSSLVLALERRADTLTAGLNESETLFKNLVFDVDSFALSFMLQLGMWLAFRTCPSSESFHLAGKAYLLGQVCKITFLALHPNSLDELPVHVKDDNEKDDDDRDEEQIESGSGDDSEEDEQSANSNSDDSGSERGVPVIVQEIQKFTANDSNTSKLKSCVFAMWYKHYSDGSKWSLNSMLGDWLREGLTQFKYIVKRSFAPHCFSAIVNTARNWIDSVPSLAKLASPTRPQGAWDDSIDGKTADRKVWIDFQSVLIARMKMSAPATAKRLSDATGTSPAAESRKRRRREILNHHMPASNTASGTPGATATSSSDPGDLISVLDRSQRADREWVASMQQQVREQRQEDREFADRRHTELMAGFQASARHHEELMHGVHEMLVFLSGRNYTHQPQFPQHPPQQQWNNNPYSITNTSNNNTSSSSNNNASN